MGRASTVCVVFVVGCSLVTDLDGLRGGGDAGSAFCDGTHLLCDDFNSSTIASIWQQPPSNTATLDIATDTYVSAPSSLRITPMHDGAHGVLLGMFHALPTDFMCSVALRIDNFPSIYDVRISPVILYDTNDTNLRDYEVTYLGYGSNGSLDEHVETGDAAPKDDSQSLPISAVDGTWHRITLTVNLASATAELDVDTQGTGTTKSITPPPKVTSIAFAVGIASGGSEPPGWVAHFDDAECHAL